jgi:thioredoxin-related protein
MKKIISLALLVTSLVGYGQINFEEVEWEEALDLAKKQNKIIFLEAYATWSEPCQLLEKYTFGDLEVANFYNENFINLRLDMEQYPGIGLAEKYQISIYPSLVFLNSDGELLHRGCGAMEANEFLELGRQAMGNGHLNSYQQRFANGERSGDFLIEYLIAMEAGCLNAEGFAQKLLSAIELEDLVNEYTYQLIEEYQWDVYSREFEHLISNQDLFEKAVGKEIIQNKIFNTFLTQYQEIYESEDLHLFGMRAFLKQLENTSFIGSDTLTTMANLHYSEIVEDWNNFSTFASQWVTMSGLDDEEEINELAWKFYLFVDDVEQLRIALEWMRQVVDTNPSPSSIDTYASLTFKLGNRKKAIELEKQAITMAIGLGEELDHYKYQLKIFQEK